MITPTPPTEVRKLRELHRRGPLPMEGGGYDWQGFALQIADLAIRAADELERRNDIAPFTRSEVHQMERQAFLAGRASLCPNHPKMDGAPLCKPCLHHAMDTGAVI